MTSLRHMISGSVLIRMIAGLLLLAVAWSVPVNLKSVTPALLKAAGH